MTDKELIHEMRSLADVLAVGSEAAILRIAADRLEGYTRRLDIIWQNMPSAAMHFTERGSMEDAQ